jgi:hypothetical protein
MRLTATVAVGLLAAPWAIALALAPHHHLGVALVDVLAAVSIPLSGLWLAWVTVAKGGGSGALATGPSAAQVADQIAGSPPGILRRELVEASGHPNRSNRKPAP